MRRKHTEDAECLLTIGEVIERTKFSKATIYRLIKDDDFPTQRKIGASARWLQSEVNEWMRTTAKATKKKAQGKRAEPKRRIRRPRVIRERLAKKRALKSFEDQ